MAKITRSSPSSSSPSSSGASSSSSFSTGSHSSGKFAWLSSFSGKFTGASQPSLPTNRSGLSSSSLSELQLQTVNGGGDAYQNTASSAVARLQRLVLQDRVMLSPSEANQSALSVAEQGATPTSFFKTVCRALFGIALVPFLPIIGLYKLGDYGLASLRKGNNPPPPAGSMPPMPAQNQPMDQQSSQPPSVNSAPPPMMTPPNNNNLTAQLPKTYGRVVNAPFQLADDGLIGSEPIPPVTFL
jgi:hypothetical protein